VFVEEIIIGDSSNVEFTKFLASLPVHQVYFSGCLFRWAILKDFGE